MKYFLVFLIAIFASFVDYTYAESKPYYDLNDAPELFEKFIKDYNREYKDDQDRAIHYAAFVESLKTINESNAKIDSATFDINYMADYTEEERQKMLGLKEPTETESQVSPRFFFIG